ncbi:hypothetical protein AAH991_40195, partial [Microbispora sp. ZYX-F-249]
MSIGTHTPSRFTLDGRVLTVVVNDLPSGLATVELTAEVNPATSTGLPDRFASADARMRASSCAC